MMHTYKMETNFQIGLLSSSNKEDLKASLSYQIYLRIAATEVLFLLAK